MALVTQSNSGSTFSSLLAPFTSVATATVRPLKGISATELATLREGDTVYTTNLRDYWKWLPASTLTDDSATEVTICAPTVVGVGAGRFERLNLASPDWMLTYGGATPVVIDAAVSLGTTSNENDGTTAATALRTDYERQRRFGNNPNYVASEYHLRFISNVPAAQEVYIQHNPKNGSQIFLHGSMTDKAGISTIFSGTSGTITAENYAAAGGGQPWQMICATIPVSWTASGTVAKRGRFTNGANIGGVFWIIKDLGGAAPNAQARLNEPQATVTFTAPFTNTTSTFTPAAGDTFVIENLTQIPNITFDVTGGGTSALTTGIICDSLDLGTGGRISSNVVGRSAVFWGCTMGPSNAVEYVANAQVVGCQQTGAPFRAGVYTIANCYNTLAITLTADVSGSLTRQMSQGNAQLRLTCPRGALTNAIIDTWSISQYGAWDNAASYPLQIVDKAYLTATATLWGNGFTGGTNTAILLFHAADLLYGAPDNALPASYFYMLTASAGVLNGAYIACGIDTSENASAVRPSVPAYDKVLGFTVDTLLSAANLSATVAAGGFGGTFFDPVTRCSMGQA